MIASIHGGTVHGIRHSVEDRANHCQPSVLQAPIFPAKLAKRLLSWSTKPNVLPPPPMEVGGRPRYGIEDYKALNVPAAGGASNLIEFQKTSDHKRMIHGFVRPSVGGERQGGGWGHQHDRPPWSAAHQQNPWHGRSPSATFPDADTPAQCFRRTVPLRSVTSTEKVHHHPPVAQNARTSLASRLDFSTTVAFQWDKNPLPKIKHPCDSSSVPLDRRVWRVPGHDVGSEGNLTQDFWRSSSGFVPNPAHMSRTELRRDRHAHQLENALGWPQRGREPLGKEEERSKGWTKEFQVGSMNRGIIERGKHRQRGALNYGNNAITGQGFDA